MATETVKAPCAVTSPMEGLTRYLFGFVVLILYASGKDACVFLKERGCEFGLSLETWKVSSEGDTRHCSI